jgi:hypothetical protein
MVTSPLHVVNIHKTCGEYGQELDAPVKPGVEAPHQGECERPQQYFNEETDRFYDDPSQILKEFSMLAHSSKCGLCLTGASTSSHGAERSPRRAMKKHEPTVQAMLRAAMVIEAIVCFLFRARLWRNSVVEHLDKPMLMIYRIWPVYIACDQVSERNDQLSLQVLPPSNSHIR